MWGGESALRPEHLRLVPITRLRLATGLLAAAFVGVGAAVTIVAFASLVVYAAPFGVEATSVALAAAVLQLVLVVLLSRIAGGLIGRLTTSRVGGLIAGVTTAGMLVVSQSGWVVIERAGQVLSTGLPEGLSALVRIVPSGWVWSRSMPRSDPICSSPRHCSQGLPR